MNISAGELLPPIVSMSSPAGGNTNISATAGMHCFFYRCARCMVCNE